MFTNPLAANLLMSHQQFSPLLQNGMAPLQAPSLIYPPMPNGPAYTAPQAAAPTTQDTYPDILRMLFGSGDNLSPMGTMFANTPFFLDRFGSP